MRLFFALPLPLDAKRVLGGWMEAHPGPRWARPEGLHLTLAFLGELPEADHSALSACGRAVSSRHGAFELETAGLSRFPRPQGASILFLEVRASSPLQALVTDLRGELRNAGLPLDPKPFRPHLTLARPRKPWSCADGPGPMAWRAERLLLLESRQGPTGSEYREAGAWELIKPPPPAADSAP